MRNSGTQEIVYIDLMKKIREDILSCTVNVEKQREKGRKYERFNRDQDFLFYEEPGNLNCCGGRRRPISSSGGDPGT